jgi:Mob1/phocein family
MSQIDTAYQLSEHLRALYNEAIHIDPFDPTKTGPIDRAKALKLAAPPKDIEKAIWLYELCRFLCEKLNLVIIALFADDPPCSAQTCVEMRASEWQYLCAVHDPPKMCCAIDYCCHTLDWAANILTSQKHFPSRMFTGQEGGGGSHHTQMRQLTNIYRRVYRVFAHAWFQHREVFWKVEKQTGLYVFFKTVCDVYGLNPGDNCTVPPEAEGITPAAESDNGEATTGDDSKTDPLVLDSAGSEIVRAPSPPSLGPTNTTKRHRSNQSVDSGIILTVLEENEEDDHGAEKKLEIIPEPLEAPTANESFPEAPHEEPVDLGTEESKPESPEPTVLVEHAEPSEPEASIVAVEDEPKDKTKTKAEKPDDAAGTEAT